VKLFWYILLILAARSIRLNGILILPVHPGNERSAPCLIKKYCAASINLSNEEPFNGSKSGVKIICRGWLSGKSEELKHIESVKLKETVSGGSAWVAHNRNRPSTVSLIGKNWK
jgi:hypothetical protein